MKFASFKNARVVRSGWLEKDGRRLDCGPYMSGALEAKDALDNLSVRKDPLGTLTAGYAGGIYNGPKFARYWVDDPQYGVPFLGSSDMLQADLSTLPLLKKTYAESPHLAYLEVKPGMTLISCSGTIGRMTYVRPDMAGMWSSQHIMKVVPDESKIPPGYLYAFLSSRYGVPLIVAGTYGAIIQHIEPAHVSAIDVPRFDSALELMIHSHIEEAAELRQNFQRKLNKATNLVLEHANLSDCSPHIWNGLGADLGFSANISVSRSLRASNYSPRVRKLLDTIEANGAEALGDLCEGGYLGTGARFKRIDCDPSEGVRLIGQKQAFWLHPEGRWITPRYAPSSIFAVDETVMVASSGTLGENEVYCQPILVTGRWLDFVYSQHFLRVVSGRLDYPGAYLFAFLRSEIAFRSLRSMSTGSKQQEIHLGFASRLPIPSLNIHLRGEIASIVREAYRDRDDADQTEEAAIKLVETAIGGTNPWPE